MPQKTFQSYQNSLKNLRDVRETVKMEEKIAAAEVHRTRVQIMQLAKYQQSLGEMLRRAQGFTDSRPQLFAPRAPNTPSLQIVLSADKGLVGGLYRKLADLVTQNRPPNAKIICVGKQGARELEDLGVVPEQISPEKETLATQLVHRYQEGNFGELIIFYNRFISLTQQKPVRQKILPLDPQSVKPIAPTGWPIFEPAAGKLLLKLSTEYLRVNLQKIFLEAKLSELAARTVTTENASAKAKVKLHDLKHAYFKWRRQTITQKQLASFNVHEMI